MDNKLNAKEKLKMKDKILLGIVKFFNNFNENFFQNPNLKIRQSELDYFREFIDCNFPLITTYKLKYLISTKHSHLASEFDQELKNKLFKFSLYLIFFLNLQDENFKLINNINKYEIIRLLVLLNKKFYCENFFDEEKIFFMLKFITCLSLIKLDASMFFNSELVKSNFHKHKNTCSKRKLKLKAADAPNRLIIEEKDKLNNLSLNKLNRISKSNNNKSNKNVSFDYKYNTKTYSNSNSVDIDNTVNLRYLSNEQIKNEDKDTEHLLQIKRKSFKNYNFDTNSVIDIKNQTKTNKNTDEKHIKNFSNLNLHVNSQANNVIINNTAKNNPSWRVNTATKSSNNTHNETKEEQESASNNIKMNQMLSNQLENNNNNNKNNINNKYPNFIANSDEKYFTKIHNENESNKDTHNYDGINTIDYSSNNNNTCTNNRNSECKLITENNNDNVNQFPAESISEKTQIFNSESTDFLNFKLNQSILAVDKYYKSTEPIFNPSISLDRAKDDSISTAQISSSKKAENPINAKAGSMLNYTICTDSMRRGKTIKDFYLFRIACTFIGLLANEEKCQINSDRAKINFILSDLMSFLIDFILSNKLNTMKLSMIDDVIKLFKFSTFIFNCK